MSRDPEFIDRQFRKLQGLWDLYWSMPRILTPAEERWWEAFLAIRDGAENTLAPEQLARCCEIATRREEFPLIVEVAQRLPEEIIAADLDLSSYVVAARIFVERDSA